MPIQGTAADIIKIAMIRVDERLQREKMRTRLILQVHDELIVEAPQDEAMMAAMILQEEMENAVKLSVPMIAEAAMGESNFYKDNFSQDSLYKFQSDAIKKVADEGSCVFVGRTADYVLRDYKNTVSVFITANIDQRIQAVCKRHGFDRAAARKYIHSQEETRASYYNYYTGKTWGHSESYDLCVNSSLLGLEGTEKFIAEFIKTRFDL